MPHGQSSADLYLSAARSGRRLLFACVPGLCVTELTMQCGVVCAQSGALNSGSTLSGTRGHLACLPSCVDAGTFELIKPLYAVVAGKSGSHQQIWIAVEVAVLHQVITCLL